MLHGFEIHSALELSSTISLSCRLATSRWRGAARWQLLLFFLFKNTLFLEQNAIEMKQDIIVVKLNISKLNKAVFQWTIQQQYCILLSHHLTCCKKQIDV